MGKRNIEANYNDRPKKNAQDLMAKTGLKRFVVPKFLVGIVIRAKNCIYYVNKSTM